ncbi:MAG: PAS domain S-box protein [Desulfobacterales bacterium]|nr:PAS domain S-box protein [Desulfobacterales bacterium]
MNRLLSRIKSVCLKNPAFRIVSIYAAFAILCTRFFDRIVFFLTKDADVVNRIQTTKCWIFIIITTSFIYVLLHKEIFRCRQAEEVLRQSREQYRSLVEGISEWIWEVNRDGVITYASPKIKSLLGYAPEEVVGKTLFDLQTEDDAKQSAEYFRKRVASLEAFEGFVSLNFHRDGRRVMVETSGMPIVDGKGNLLGFRGMNRDVTKRKQAEDEAKESQRKLVTLMGNIRGMAYRCRNDSDWTMEFVSQGCLGLTGYLIEDLVGNRTLAYNELIHPDDRDAVWYTIQKRLSEKLSFQLNYRILTKTGETKQVWEQGVGVFSDAGELLALEGFITDVTEQKQAEEEIRRNCDIQSTINALLSLTQIDTFLDELLQRAVDLVLSGERFSPEATGCSIYLVENEADVLNMKASKGVPESVRRTCASVPFGRCLCGQAALTGRIQFASHLDDRHEICCKGMGPHGHYCAPILLSGRTIGVVNIYLKEGHRHDPKEESFLSAIANNLAVIIQRKRMSEEKERLERQLRQAQKMEAIGTLAGGIAHDFNNILMAIFGYADMAMMELPADSEAAAQIAEVLRAANRARDLVKQILSFSRQTDHERNPVQVHLIVKEALKLLRASIPTTIEIRRNIDPACGYVLADPTQIHQVIMNLCTNAYQAMRTGAGVMAVSLTMVDIGRDDHKAADMDLVPGPYLKLEISDSGHGMDRATLERIFEPYFTTKRKLGGTGLGLSVVHGIVKSHGGHITVYSEPGKGATFLVYLPMIASAAESPRSEDVKAVPKGNERILLLDDDASIVKLEQSMLESLGYEVTAEMSSEKALQIFRAAPEKFDLAITDMTMPHMTGTKLAQQLLAIRPDIPIILCTGFSELINEETARAMGIREYIMKPVVRKQMAEIVRKVLDEK